MLLDINCVYRTDKNNITLTIGLVTGDYFECKFADHIKFMDKILTAHVSY